jgi:hypothetical protein
MDAGLFGQAAAACSITFEDQGYEASLEGRLSATRGVVPGGVRDDRSGQINLRKVEGGRRWLQSL